MPFRDLVQIRARVLPKEPFGRHDLAGGAIAALKGVFLQKGLLDRSQFVPVHEAFKRRNQCSFRLDGKGHTGVPGNAVHEDRACPTLPTLAPDLCSREAEALPEDIEERPAGLHYEPMPSPIDRKGDLAQH